MTTQPVSEVEPQTQPPQTARVMGVSLREAFFYVALFCVMLASLPVNWLASSTLFLCCMLSILAMVIVAVVCRDARRAYAVGYVVANFGYLVIVGYFDANLGAVPAAATFSTAVPLPTTLLLNELYELASTKCELIREVFIAAGHAYVGVFLGLAGGRLGAFLYRGQRVEQ